MVLNSFIRKNLIAGIFARHTNNRGEGNNLKVSSNCTGRDGSLQCISTMQCHGYLLVAKCVCGMCQGDWREYPGTQGSYKRIWASQ